MKKIITNFSFQRYLWNIGRNFRYHDAPSENKFETLKSFIHHKNYRIGSQTLSRLQDNSSVTGLANDTSSSDIEVFMFHDQSQVSILQVSDVSTQPAYQDKNKDKKCRCRSMFSIAPCGTAEITALRPADERWAMAIQKFEYNRRKGDYYFGLNNLSRFLPQNFIITNFQRRKDIMLNSGYIENEFSPLPYVNCKEHLYKINEKYRCLLEIKKRKKKALDIFFIGDSHARFLMTNMLLTLVPAFTLSDSLKGKMHELYTKKIKVNWNFHHDSINTTFFWQPYLIEPEKENLGILELICSNVTSKKNIQKPDILVISIGMWNAIFNVGSIGSFLQNIKDLRNCLSNLANRIPIVWVLSPPIKTYWMKSKNSRTELNLLGSIIWMILGDTNVLVWDTISVLSMRELAFCPPYLSLPDNTSWHLTPADWNCQDPVHSGRLFNNRAINMLWNLICNKLNDRDPNYCCA